MEKVKNRLDSDYQTLLQDILDNGIVRNDRTGTGSLSVFVRTIRHKMSDGFPLLTTKQVPFKMIATELLWFLKGDTNIKYLVDNNCNIWVGDAYKNYCKYTSSNDSKWNEWMRDNGDGTLSMYTKEEFINKIKTDDKFAKKWGEMGPIYGKQWRDWGGKYDHPTPEMTDMMMYVKGVDQIIDLIHILKTTPDSRRMVVNAWNVADIPDMVLPPCHYGFECYTRELTDDEIVEYWYKNIHPETKYDKRGDTYYYYVEEENMWFPHTGSDILWGMRPDCPSRALSLKFNIRSNDVPLGLPFNIASYGLLLLLLAKQVNMIPDELVYVGTDVHIYLNQIEGAKEQIGREPYPLPTVTISDRPVNDISEYTLDDIKIANYQSGEKIFFPLSN